MLVGITGTNGKTSTASYLRQILSLTGRRAVALTTLGVEDDDGTWPLSYVSSRPEALAGYLDGLGRGVDLVVEATSEALGRGDLDATVFDVAVLTTFSVDHLDVHGSMKAYADAKLRLFGLLGSKGIAVVPRGNPLSAAAARLAGRSIWFDPSSPPEHGLHADFLRSNCVAAMAAAAAVGVPAPSSAEFIDRLITPPGRMEHVTYANGGCAYVDFAHNEGGLAAALRAARALARGRVLVVFGCGGGRDAGKRRGMGAIACRLADRVVVTDDNPRNESPAAIRAEIMRGCPGAMEIADRADAVVYAVGELRPGDILLVAGRGHEATTERAGAVLPLDDRRLVLRAVEGRAA